MNGIWPRFFFGVATVYFGVRALQIAPTFFRLLAALFAGRVKWSGPRIHDTTPSVSKIRQELGIRYENLYSVFFFNSAGVFGAFVFSLSMFLSYTSLLRGHILINWTWTSAILTLFALAGGVIGFKKARQNAVQVNMVLSDLADQVEPRSVDGHSAEAETAIEHPLIGYRHLQPDSKRALDMFYESVRCQQDGNEQRALILYQGAMRTDPSLHNHAREFLSTMAQACSPNDEGAIHYWLGIHSEHLSDLKQAAASYEKAINAFHKIGYQKRESRAHNNLGHIKMQMRDPSAMEEFEKAVALNPQNGIAHINIGTTYYRISYRGDPRFERALDAFANAIVADPSIYGPIVASCLRSIGYTWKEDWEDITLRVASKQFGVAAEASETADKMDVSKTGHMSGADVETSMPVEHTEALKTYRNEKHGFEIDIPEDWSRHVGFAQDVDVAFTHGPNEILNIVVETMGIEPTPNFNESFFKIYAKRMNFTNCEFGRFTVGNREHTWTRYQVDSTTWSKKYMIVLKGKGYAITASCHNKEIIAPSERVWDAIAGSFRLL